MEDKERGLRQRFEFCKQVWGGMYYQITEKIQSPGSYLHHDFVARLNSSCENFRGELGFQLNWIKDVQGNMIQGVQNLAHAVGIRLIQNGQRNQTQEGITR